MPEQTERDCELCTCEQYAADPKYPKRCICRHITLAHRSPVNKPKIKMTVDK